MVKISSGMESVPTYAIFGAATIGCFVAASFFSQSEYTPEKLFDETAGNILEIAHIPNPLDVDLVVERSGGSGGKIEVNERLGRFTVYANSSFSRINELFGIKTDEITVERDGFLVGRLRIPGLTSIDTLPRSDGGLHVTITEGGRDVGIDVSDVFYEILRPETARIKDGVSRCKLEIGDDDYSGCTPGVDTDDKMLSRLPFAGANDDGLAADAANNINTEYGRLTDPCFIENVMIPEFNKIYEKYGFPRIDGENQQDQVMKTLIRYLLRSRVSPGTHPSEVSVNLTGIWHADLPLEVRVEQMIDAMGVADSIEPGSIKHSGTFCLEKTSTYEGKIVYLQGFNEEDGIGVSWIRIAIGGMENGTVPVDFDMETGKFVEGTGK